MTGVVSFHPLFRIGGNNFCSQPLEIRDLEEKAAALLSSCIEQTGYPSWQG
jgi:hypothetical protein